MVPEIYALLPPYGHRKSKFWKNGTTSEDIIIFQMCTIDDSHMMYGSWDIECNRQNFLSFWTVFLPFYPLNNLKNQNFLKNDKTSWRYYHFTQVQHKWQSYNVWFLRYGVWLTESFVILGRFLPFYSPWQPKKPKFWKNEKNPGDIIILHIFTINDNHMMYGSWNMKRDGHNFLSF